MPDDRDIKVSGIAGANLKDSHSLRLNRLRSWAENNRKKYRTFDEVIREISGLDFMEEVHEGEYEDIKSCLESIRLLQETRI